MSKLARCARRTDLSPSGGGEHSPPYTIVAIGNRYRQDDGVGPWIGARLCEVGLKVVEVGDDLTQLLEGWPDTNAMILLEAVCSNSKPGTIHRLEVGNQQLPAMFSRFSSHTLNLAEALELSRILGILPPRVVIYGVEGRCFGFGEGLSLEVEQAAQEVVATLQVAFA